MDRIIKLVAFRSERFAPVLPEDCQVNPGHYGAELAFWLCTRLYEECGIGTSYPEPEDLEWRLSYATKAGDEFTVHCENTDGARDRWLISLQRHGRKLFGRDKPPFDLAGNLIGALRKLLEREASVTELNWHYDLDVDWPAIGPDESGGTWEQ